MSLAVASRVGSKAERGAGHDWLSANWVWSRWIKLSAVALAAVVVVLVALFRTGIVPTDPWHYVQSAIAFPDAKWVPLGYTRYGMILPLLPVAAVFGNSEVVYYVWPLIGTGLLTASLYLLATRFWGPLAGLVAVLLGLSSPITFVNLSRGYPDVLSTGVLGLAMVLAFRARDVMTLKRPAPGLLLAVGFLLGWAFETRETTILAWPVLLVILFPRRDVFQVLIRIAFAVGLGILVWVLADLAIGAIGYGDILLRVHAFTKQDLATTTNGGDLNAVGELVGRSRWFYLLAVPRLLLRSPVGGFCSLVMMAAAVPGLVLGRGARFTTVLFLVTFFGFVGITGGFFPDHPSGRIDIARYWIGFLPWAGLAATGLIFEVAARLAGRVRDGQGAPSDIEDADVVDAAASEKGGSVYGLGDLTEIAKADRRTGAGRAPRLIVLVLLGLLIVGTPLIRLGESIHSNQSMPINGGTQLSELRDYMTRSPGADPRLFTDWYTIRLLPIYQRRSFGGPDLWQAQLISLTGPGDRPGRGDLVAINSLNNLSCPFCHLVASQWNQARGPVPSSWHEIWASTDDNLVLYRVT